MTGLVLTCGRLAKPLPAVRLASGSRAVQEDVLSARYASIGPGGGGWSRKPPGFGISWHFPSMFEAFFFDLKDVAGPFLRGTWHAPFAKIICFLCDSCVLVVP